MPNQNGELSLKELQAQFRTMSLQELSTEAIAIAKILETDDEDQDNLFEQLQQYLILSFLSAGLNLEIS